MTRITDFGRKRTYLESGIGSQNDAEIAPVEAQLQEQPAVADDSGASAPPAKKKRKRTPKSKRDGHGTRPMGSSPPGAEGSNDTPKSAGEGSAESTEPAKSSSKPSKKAKKKKDGRKDKKYVSPSEQRRLKRIVEKNATTTCFACREKGHSAKDCPKNESGEGSKQVGICYRCGSTRHGLSRCKKPVDPENPMPHASCFVCNGKGHLASSCPQNKSKGIYPNGGSCKLCGDITHLAKDCGIRQKDTSSLTAVMGIDEKDIGADEDDFHTIGRRKQELERDDKHSEKVQKSMNVKVGAQSGIVKQFGSAPDKAKKVVYF